jgi:ABC-type glycerol-3-phosphate transport system permease component
MSASGRGLWVGRVILSLTALLVLLPLVYQVGISFKQPQEIFTNPLLPFTFPPSLENYAVVLDQMDIPRYLFNSLVFAGGVTLGQIALGVPAAFAFSYYQFRFKNILLALVLLSLMVPFVVTYIPNYLLLAGWRMINTLHGMILPMLGVSLGFGIFLLRQHFLSFPREVTEAAMLDGANSWQVLWRILLPANLSPVTAVAVYVLINTWNQFIWPLLIGGGNPNSYTLTVAVQLYFTSPEGGDYWGAIMAASVLTSLPTVVMYFLMRKRILTTFVEGAVKG